MLHRHAHANCPARLVSKWDGQMWNPACVLFVFDVVVYRPRRWCEVVCLTQNPSANQIKGIRLTLKHSTCLRTGGLSALNAKVRAREQRRSMERQGGCWVESQITSENMTAKKKSCRRSARLVWPCGWKYREKKVLNHMGHMPFVMDLTAMLLTNPYGPLLLQYTLDIVAGSLTFQVPDNTLIYLNYWCIVQNGGCQKKKNVLVRRWHGSLSMHRLFGSQVWEDAMWNHPQLSCCYCAPARPLLHKP